MIIPTMIIPQLLYWLLLVIYVATVAGIIIVVISENRNPVKSLAWVTVLMLLPIAGIVLYIFFGRNLKSRRLISRRNKRKLLNREQFKQLDIKTLPLSIESRQQIRLARSLTGSIYFPGNKVQIFTDGKSKFEALLKDIDNAKKFINLQYYIFENDEIGNRVKLSLMTKAQEGVKVRVIYDHVGSFSVSNSFFKEMANAGVEIYPFLKVTFPQFANRINWRNHRKVVIIDGSIGYIGGMNIADRYVYGNSLGTWRDTHLRIEGPAVGGLEYSFAVDWNFMGRPLLTDHTSNFNMLPEAPTGIQVVTSGPMGNWSSIAMLFLKSISNAKKFVYLQTPYFLPTESLLKALQGAALAKLDVRVMIPRKSDSKTLTYASFSYIKECLKAGVKFYLYEKGMLHSKTLIVDEEFCSTGSSNFDFRSFEHNFEVNAFIYGKETNAMMRQTFVDDMAFCTRITNTKWRHRPTSQKIMESLVRLLSPVL